MRSYDDGDGHGGAFTEQLNGNGHGGWFFDSADGYAPSEAVWGPYVWVRTSATLMQLGRAWAPSGDGRAAFTEPIGDGPGSDDA